MIIKHPIEIPSAILAIIQQTRQHHIHLFRNELYEYQLKVDSHNLNANEGEEYWHIFTDFENQMNGINKAFSNCLVKNNKLVHKVYRQDIVIQNGKKVVEEIMFWPVIYDVVSDIYVEDVPYFPMQRIMLNDTKIEIYAFPWFDCTIEIYPNASPILGLLELWFQKWYYPRGQSYPFLDVIHRFDIIYKDFKKEIFQIDLGTAPANALVELIFLTCNPEINKIRII